MAETHQDGRQQILATESAQSKEWFTKEDILNETSFTLDYVTTILNLMAQDGQLTRYSEGRSAKFKILLRSQKGMAAMPWRKHTNTELRVTSFHPWTPL